MRQAIIKYIYIKHLKMVLSKQEKAILNPIVLYSAMGCAITKKQALGLAYKEKITDGELDKILAKLKKCKIIDFNDKYIYLNQNQKNSSKDCKKFAQIIFNKNKKKLTKLAKFPFVRAIVLTNSLAFETSHKNSDVDLLIICEKGKLSICRDLIKIWMTSTSSNKEARSKKLAIDIWLDEDNLNISDFKLRGNDIYFENWLATATPIYSEKSIFKEFVKSNLLFKNFPNYKIKRDKIFALSKKDAQTKKSLENFLSAKPFSLIVKLSQKQMIARLNRYAKKVGNKGAILISVGRLRFNIPDKREEIQKKFEKLLPFL